MDENINDEQEKLETRGRKKKEEIIKDYLFDYDRYYEKISDIEIEIEPITKRQIKNVVHKEVLRIEYAKLSHLMRCRIRCAKAFGVTIQRIEEVYNNLNGKKIDGIYINDLIDRFGFSNGNCINRVQLKDKYKLSSINHVEIAFENLKKIILEPDFIKSYNSYIKKYLQEVEKEKFQEEVNLI